MNSIAGQLTASLGDTLRKNAPLAPYTWMRVGGPAEFLLEVDSGELLVQAHTLCRQLGIPLTFLGGGSNVFADDEGLDGLVLINRVNNVEWDETAKTAKTTSGCDLDWFVGEISKRGWGDMTFAAGIPGTIGGGLVGGAGAYGKLLYEFVDSVRVLHADGSIETAPTEALGVRYRESDALGRGDIVLSINFRPFEESNPETLLGRIAEIKAGRQRKHPPESLHCAGSFFKNLPPEKPDGWRVPAGKILDECGAKNMSEGGAAVFEKHANIIVNAGNATAKDINALADRMAKTVRELKGVELVREVRYLSNRRGA